MKAYEGYAEPLNPMLMWLTLAVPTLCVPPPNVALILLCPPPDPTTPTFKCLLTTLVIYIIGYVHPLFKCSQEKKIGYQTAYLLRKKKIIGNYIIICQTH